VGGAAVWAPITAQDVSGIVTYSATPPGSPYDGQLWACPVATGVVWMFRFNQGASSLPWEFVGGGGLEADVDSTAAISSAAANTWYDDASQPTLTLPRAGTYQIDFGGAITAQVGSVSVQVRYGLWQTPPSGSLTDTGYYGQGSSYNVTVCTVARSVQVGFGVAGCVLRVRALTETATNIYLARRWLRVRPMNVA
jgi:hypothetical protein